MKLAFDPTSILVFCVVVLACQPQVSGQAPTSQGSAAFLGAQVSKEVQPFNASPLGQPTLRLAELSETDRIILADEHTSADIPRLIDAYAEKQSHESLTVINRACLSILFAEIGDLVAAESHARVLEQQLASNEGAQLDKLTRAIVLAALETVHVRRVDSGDQRMGQRKDLLDSIEELSNDDLQACTVLKGVCATMLFQRALLTGTPLTSAEEEAAFAAMRVAVEQGSRGEAYAVADLLSRLDQGALPAFVWVAADLSRSATGRA